MNICFYFSCVNTYEWVFWVGINCIVNFIRNCQWLYHLAFLPVIFESPSCSSASLPALSIARCFCCLLFGHSNKWIVEFYSIVNLHFHQQGVIILIVFSILFAICIFWRVRYLFKSFVYWYWVFLLLSFEGCSYILDTSPLPGM